MSESAARVWRGGRLFLLLAVALGAVLILGRSLAGFYTEVLWFRTAGYASVYWTRVVAEGGMRILVGTLTAFVAFLSFRVVARSLGDIQIRRRFGNLEIAERLPARVIRWGVLGAALLLGLWLGASFPPGAGLRLLLFLNAPEWGVTAPPLGADASFFVFALPLLEGAVILGLALTFLLFSFSAAGYAATGSLRLRGGVPQMAPLARKHLAFLAAIFLFILACRFWLSPYLLMLDGNSEVQGIFGYADARSRVPGFRVLAVITALGGVTTWLAGVRRRLSLLVGGVATVILAAVLILQVYPSVVQRFQVQPNELSRETPYIEANLRFTRLGFGLHDLRRENLDPMVGVVPDWEEARRQLEGLPTWTRPALLTTFRSLEARQPYYDFDEVAIDRYPGPGGAVPVAISVREIDPGGILDPNWQNLHLRYLAGMGAVASAATRATPEGRPPMFLSGIPPTDTGNPAAPAGLTLRDPYVFFGSRPQRYGVVTPGVVPVPEASGGTADPVDSSDPPPAIQDTASAAGLATPRSVAPVAPQDIQGIRMDSFLRTVALAWRFGETNLLFASEVTPESRFVFRRSVVERALAIAPFLRFLEPPTPVVHQGRIVWILDGFTTTRRFPLSALYTLPGGGPVSWVRNSVKVTVDALTGEVHLYRLDVEDPLLEAWSRVFPELLLPLDEMPEELRRHLRYPRALMELQAEVLLQYHQQTAPLFHGQQQVWARPQELALGTRPVAYESEYGHFRLPGAESPEFLLTTVFVPAGRPNLTAFFAARCDPERYGELLLFEVQVEDQVPGPRQVEALVEQDPIISQQFSLWRQGGSQVWSGHLHVVPVAGAILYMESIFLAAEADAIPELRRFVVSDGTRVVMDVSLEAALRELARVGGYAGPTISPVQEERAGALLGADPRAWPREALDLLDAAEARLRQGDWSGFGEALQRLRELLRETASAGGGGG